MLVGFVVDKVALGQVLSWLFRYNFVSSPQYHTYISYIYNRSYIILASDSILIQHSCLSLSLLL
jgi:hypothetical protein